MRILIVPKNTQVPWRNPAFQAPPRIGVVGEYAPTYTAEAEVEASCPSQVGARFGSPQTGVGGLRRDRRVGEGCWQFT